MFIILNSLFYIIIIYSFIFIKYLSYIYSYLYITKRIILMVDNLNQIELLIILFNYFLSKLLFNYNFKNCLYNKK